MPSTEISTKTYYIIFHDNFPSVSCDPIHLKMSILHKKIGEKQYYDISYEWSDPTNKYEIMTTHPANPFYPDLEEESDGVIVAANHMTTQMINHLIMNDKDLEEVCGAGTANDYRIRIIRALSTFWD
tara:strand:- start:212 stop:592 length:381 start_codon:yes stop_codon:yes gene_type:complete